MGLDPAALFGRFRAVGLRSHKTRGTESQMRTEDEKLTEDEKEVAFVAWALAARNMSYVPTPAYLSAAESMRTRGWLSSRTLDNGDAAYEWTPTGEETFKVYNAALSRHAANN